MDSPFSLRVPPPSLLCGGRQWLGWSGSMLIVVLLWTNNKNLEVGGGCNPKYKPPQFVASNAFNPTSLSGLRGSRVSTHLPGYWSTRWGCLVSGEVIQSLSPGSSSAPSFRHSPWWSPPGTRSLPSPGGSPVATRVSAFLTAAPHPELSLSPNLHIFLLCFLTVFVHCQGASPSPGLLSAPGAPQKSQ